MIRELLCQECAQKFNLHTEDISNGAKMKKVAVRANLPPNLFIEVSAGGKVDKILVTHLVCDHCNEAIEDGSVAVATTTFSKDMPYSPWESEYGEVLGEWRAP